MFITLEGIDGCGKTTQAKMLQTHLVNLGYPVTRLREPGSTNVGEKIREILEGPHLLDPKTKVLLYNAARVELVKQKIKPSLDNGWIVLCDRFYHSTLAYQVWADGEIQQDVEKVIEYSIFGVKPDMTIFLDTPIIQALTRAHYRDSGTSNVPASISDEKYQYYEKVSAGYTKMFELEENYWIYLDVHSASAQAIHYSILEAVMPKVESWWKEKHGENVSP